MPLQPFALTLALLALAPHAATLAADALSRPSARLAGVAEQYYEAKARFYPLSATYSGDNRFDDQLAINIAPAEVKKRFSPGQALGYKIGSLKIVELRARAARLLGPKFRLAEFHHAVLGDSNMPLRLLEAKIDRWIAQQVMQ